MRLKKLVALVLLIILLIMQFSYIKISKAQTGNVEDLIQIPVAINAKTFHYDQLNDLGKRIYDGIEYMRSGNYFLKQGKSFDLAEGENPYITQDKLEEYTKGNTEIKTAMNAARYAFYADHPEVFYVNFQNLSLRVTKGTNGKYHANLGSGNLKTYYIDGFVDKEAVNVAAKELEEKVNSIVQKANAVEQEEGTNLIAEKIKLVHNEIIKEAGYRLESDCQEGNEGFLGTPYGALVKKEAVCEGYARALKMVLDKLNIPCILVQGVHQNEGSAAVPHMWNYVQIEKETATRSVEKVWYAIDATLDDPFLRKIEIEPSEDREPGWDIVEGFENTRYCFAGTETMNKEHTVLETVEAAGNYVFTYPELNYEDYGIDSIINNNGLLVKFKQEGTETEEYKAGDYYISYNGKGYAKAREEGKYILMKYHEYRPGDEVWVEGKWGYMDPEPYAGGFKDYDDHLYISVPNSEYVEFAVTTLAPSDGIAGLTYQGDESDFVAQSGKLYNPHGIYKAPPYIKKQIPPPTQNVTVGNTYKAEITYDDTLVLEEGAQAGYKIVIRRLTGEIVTPEGSDIITNFRFDGTNKITFDFKPSKMYADDNASYTIYITGLVGKNSGKEPLEIMYGAANDISCAYRMNKAQSWSVFARPTLIEDEDLSMNGWQTKDGESVSEKLKSRIALVTTKVAPEEANTMNDLMANEPKDPESTSGEKQNVLASETYNISLNVCRKYVVKTGHKLKLSVGFPAGYGPNDAGVTFKAYHFMRDDNGNVTGVEEIPCVVTQYGLIIMCDSFSPFAVAVVEDDGTHNQNKAKAVILSGSEGGTIKSISNAEARANAEESSASNTMFMLEKDEEKWVNIKANDGYILESLTVGGMAQDLSNMQNKTDINAKITYDSIEGESGIVEATFVARSVTEAEEARGEEAVAPVVAKPTITLPEKLKLNIGENLTITPQVTAEAETVTYQWYKDGVALNGKREATLTIENIQASDFGRYTLKVTATSGTLSEETTSAECIVYKGTFNVSIEKVSASTDLENLQLGEEFAVNLKVSGIDQEGIIALAGKLEYDKTILDYVDIQGPDGWTVDKDSIDENDFKFVTNNSQVITGDTTIFTVSFKVKNDISKTTESSFGIEDITASGGYGVLTAENSSTPIIVVVPEKDVTSNIYVIDVANNEISGIRPRKRGTVETEIAGTTIKELIEGLETLREIEIYYEDENNVKVIIEKEDYATKIVKTGYKAKIGEHIYNLVVSGDIDGDGEISANDLAKMKLHLIANKNSEKDKNSILLGIYKKAADLDLDNEITINDLARLQLALIGVRPIR